MDDFSQPLSFNSLLLVVKPFWFGLLEQNQLSPVCPCLSPHPSCYSMLEYDSENLNSEEIYSSLRGVTEAIQNFSFRSQEDLVEPLRRDGKRDGMVS